MLKKFDFSSFIPKFNLFKSGFTLAEVLITLGIIGVVAAVTLPVLIVNHQKQVVVTGLEKASSELNQILSMAKADYGDPSGWDYYEKDNLDKWVQTYFEPYVKLIGSGTCANSHKCFGIAPMYSLGYKISSNSANPMAVQYIVVKAGIPAAYVFSRYGDVYEPLTRVRVYVRTPKRYAFVGKDVFTFIFDYREKNPVYRLYVPHDGNVPVYNYDKSNIIGTGWGACNTNARGGGYWVSGDACGALIMVDGWKISRDYPW